MGRRFFALVVVAWCCLQCVEHSECSTSQACANGQICERGSCACPALHSLCSDRCVALSSDEQHCGACQRPCASGERCEDGKCAKAGACPSGFVRCQQGCKDPAYHPQHCGSCGKACGPRKLCWDGACICPQGQELCGSQCVDLQIDGRHCGACDKACSKGRFCSAGRCVAQCPTATPQSCAGGCVELQSHPLHCGGCDKACVPGQRCQSGACSCPAGLLLCEGRCLDASAHPLHCGACGNACTGNKRCNAGRCTPTCPAQTPVVCAGGCFDTATSTRHCGGCHRRCSPGQECVEGKCVEARGPDRKDAPEFPPFEGPPGSTAWSLSAGGSATNAGDAADCVAFDSSGNIYIAGQFTSTATFGKDSLKSQGLVSLLVARISPSGQWVWARTSSKASTTRASKIRVDGNGDVVVVGRFSGDIALGSIPLTSKGSDDLFVAKLDKDGKWLWARSGGSTGRDIVTGLDVDASGNIALGGTFTSEATFGNHKLSSKGDNDIFVAKLDKDGKWLWAQSAGGTSDDGLRDVAMDDKGNVAVVGYISGTVDMGALGSFASAGDADMFFGRLDKGGSWLWAKTAGSKGNDRINGVDIDAKGDIYVGGFFSDHFKIGVTSLQNKGSFDLFVGQMDSNGTWRWIQQAGSAEADVGYDVEVDAQRGGVWLHGVFSNTLTLGNPIRSQGSIDALISRLDSSGQWVWATSMGSPGDDRCNSLAPLPSGLLIAVGHFSEPVTLGGQKHTPSGRQNLYVWALQP